MPEKTATEWERAADEVDRAEWRLLDALDAGDEAAISAAEDELARCQRRTARLQPNRRRSGSVDPPPGGEPSARGVPRLPGFSAGLSLGFAK